MTDLGTLQKFCFLLPSHSPQNDVWSLFSSYISDDFAIPDATHFCSRQQL